MVLCRDLKFQVKRQGTEKLAIVVQKSFQGLGAIEMKRNLTPHHPQGGKQTKESENMISVEVGYKNMMNSRGIDSILPETNLGSFSTID
jgi:hypothetical protein